MRRVLMMGFILLATGWGCGSDDEKASQNNATTGSNNATTGSNNVTNGTNNVTTGSNNVTTGTNNVTTGTNNNICSPLDPPVGECDPFCQTGCGDGESCIINSEATAECITAGTGAEGEACEAADDCSIGTVCAGPTEEERTCRRYCLTLGEDECPSDSVCIPIGAVETLGVCTRTEDRCGAVPEDTCTDPLECYDTIAGRACLPSGDLDLGEECLQFADCLPGLRCAAIANFVGNPKTCRELCDPFLGSNECEAGQECVKGPRTPDGKEATWGGCTEP